jgi:hypothetical protein
MTARSAASSSTVLAKILEVFPDYDHYTGESAVAAVESPFRLALGRVLKNWGDRLLDVIESHPQTLSRAQAEAIDTLVDSIGKSFRALNTPVAASEFDPADTSSIAALRTCDANILRLVEEVLDYTQSLKPRQLSTLWIDHNAFPLYRRLARLHRELEARNAILGIRLTGRTSIPVREQP